MQNLSNLLARRRATYSVLIGIILLTIPCYIIGAIALAIAPRDREVTPSPQASPQATTPLFIVTTVTSPAATATLADLPTQFVPATITLPPPATETATPTATPTVTLTGTQPPTATPTDTPTATLPPTVTNTPPTPPTETPTVTNTPEEPMPTETATETATATEAVPPTITPAP